MHARAASLFVCVPIALVAAACPTRDLGFACLGDGAEGTLRLTIEAPSDVPAQVRLVGADGSAQIASSAGDYPAHPGLLTVSPRAIRIGDGFVPQVLRAPGEDVCIGAGEITEADVIYAADPGAGKLWLATGASLLAVSSEGLSADPAGPVGAAATVETRSGVSSCVVDARDGTFTTIHASSLSRFGRGALGTSGAPSPLAVITAPSWQADATGESARRAAVDAEGALWVARPFAGRVERFGGAQLESSSEVDPEFGMTLAAPRALAFDAEGALWVATEHALLAWSHAHIGAPDPGAPDATIALGDDASPALLAFGRDGALWTLDSASRTLFRIDVAHVGALQPERPTRAIGLEGWRSGDVIVGIAWDHADGLWLTTQHGRLARLLPSQLASSGSVTPAPPPPRSRGAQRSIQPSSQVPTDRRCGRSSVARRSGGDGAPHPPSGARCATLRNHSCL